MSISILCPTRGRPAMAARMANSALGTAGDTKVEILLGIDEDEQKKYESAFYDKASNYVRLIKYPELNPIMKWNLLYHHSGGDMMMHCGDDVIFETRGWADEFAEKASKYSDGIYCIVTHDGREDNSWPHYTIGREWAKTVGYFSAPWFFNWCADIWTTNIAQDIGRLIHLPHVMLRHNKVQDNTWRRVRMGYWNQRDRMLYDQMGIYRQFDAHRLRERINALQTVQERKPGAVSEAAGHASGE